MGPIWVLWVLWVLGPMWLLCGSYMGPMGPMNPDDGDDDEDNDECKGKEDVSGEHVNQVSRVTVKCRAGKAPRWRLADSGRRGLLSRAPPPQRGAGVVLAPSCAMSSAPRVL